jgi:hypothetical protein
MTRASLTRRVGIGAALFGAACSGRLALLDEPVGAGDHTASGGRVTSANGGGCDLDQWRPGAGDTPRPIECGVCSCVGDELVCDERPCLPERQIVECPTDPYSFDTTRAVGSGVEGYKYHAEVMGPGGCTNDDYVVCYVPLNLVDNPLDSYSVRIRTPPAAAACDSVAFQTFDVDLTPLASLLEPDSGLIDVEGEYLILGDLSCSDHQDLAWRDIGRIDVQPAECQVDSDCVGVYGYTSCTSNGCRVMATDAEGAAAIQPLLQSVDEMRCGPFFAAGCEPPTMGSCDGSNVPLVQCRNGWCTPAYP